MQEKLDALGQADLVAISVDSPEVSESLRGKLSLTFPVLSDPNRVAIGAYGVADDGRQIARPATFVVSRDGKVLFAHVGENPRDRPDIAAVIAAVPAP